MNIEKNPDALKTPLKDFSKEIKNATSLKDGLEDTLKEVAGREMSIATVPQDYVPRGFRFQGGHGSPRTSSFCKGMVVWKTPENMNKDSYSLEVVRLSVKSRNQEYLFFESDCPYALRHATPASRVMYADNIIFGNKPGQIQFLDFQGRDAAYYKKEVTDFIIGAASSSIPIPPDLFLFYALSYKRSPECLIKEVISPHELLAALLGSGSEAHTAKNKIADILGIYPHRIPSLTKLVGKLPCTLQYRPGCTEQYYLDAWEKRQKHSIAPHDETSAINPLKEEILKNHKGLCKEIILASSKPGVLLEVNSGAHPENNPFPDVSKTPSPSKILPSDQGGVDRREAQVLLEAVRAEAASFFAPTLPPLTNAAQQRKKVHALTTEAPITHRLGGFF